MFNITSVEIRQKKDGGSYKALTGDYNGEEVKVSLWEDDIEYETVKEGDSMDRRVYKNDKGYWNIEGRKSPAVKTNETKLTDARLDALYHRINLIGKHLGISEFLSPVETLHKGLEVPDGEIPF
jgi:hypothetical protein